MLTSVLTPDLAITAFIIIWFFKGSTQSLSILHRNTVSTDNHSKRFLEDGLETKSLFYYKSSIKYREGNFTVYVTINIDLRVFKCTDKKLKYIVAVM